MTSRRKSFRNAIAILSLIAPILVVQAAFPSAAQARCYGEGEERISKMYNIDGSPMLYEQPTSGTCNGDTQYYFRFRSDATGFRASVHMYVNGEWQSRVGRADKNWYYHSFNDTNSAASIFYCLDDTAGTFICGAGHNWGFYYAVGGINPAEIHKILNLGF